MDDIVKDFLIESGENLDRLDQELVQFEADPQSKELVASIFRTIHTIKGSCGFLGFTRLEKVAHAGESLLSRLRDAELSLTAEVTSGLLAMVDAVRHMLSEIQSTGQDGENDYPELLLVLKQLQGAGTKNEATNIQKEQVVLRDAARGSLKKKFTMRQQSSSLPQTLRRKRISQLPRTSPPQTRRNRLPHCRLKSHPRSTVLRPANSAASSSNAAASVLTIWLSP